MDHIPQFTTNNMTFHFFNFLTPYPKVAQYKYLGVIINESGTNEIEMEYLMKKLEKYKPWFKRLAGMKINLDIRNMFFKLYVAATVRYGFLTSAF